MRKTAGFRSFQQFESDVLRGRAGPLVNAVEDMADEMYHIDFDEEFASMWDTADGEDEI